MSTNLASLLEYWVGSMERLRIFEKWKVWKGFHGKEEGVVLSWNLKGFWIWTRSKLYTSPIVPSCGPSDSVGWWSTESGLSLLWEWTLRNFEKCQSWKECKIRKREVSSVWIWKGFEFGRGRVLGWGLMVESNVHQPCFPPQSLETRVDLLWKGSLWKIWKTQSPKRVKGKGRGSCPQLEFERVLNLEEVDPKSFCMGGSNVHQPCFPSRSLDHWGSVLWEVGNVKNAKSEKGERERKRELSSVWIWKGFEFGEGRVLGWDPMVGSNVHQPCFPPQVLTGYYGKGVCEKCEKHKVPKELVSK